MCILSIDLIYILITFIKWYEIIRLHKNQFIETVYKLFGQNKSVLNSQLKKKRRQGTDLISIVAPSILRTGLLRSEDGVCTLFYSPSLLYYTRFMRNVIYILFYYQFD